MIQFTVSGQPIAKGRPRFRIVKPKDGPDFVSTYTPAETVAYEARISKAAKVAMGGRFPSSAPIEIMIELRMQIPVSWTKKKRLAASLGQVWATKKPDAGNVQKAIEDAMNGIVYVDDSQIVTLTVRKIYHAEPCMIVAVRELEGESA
jgi:Holliday junction resolvase RusA-like endonuclease